MSASTTEEDFIPTGDERSMSLPDTTRDVAVVCLINVPLQVIVTDLSLGAILAGLLALYAVCVLGVLLTKYVPFYLPSVAWISLVGIAASLPFVPWGPWFTGIVENIDFLAMAVPALAYAGLAVSTLELEVMRRSGLKLVLVAVLVFIGTYVGSAAIADFMLWLT